MPLFQRLLRQFLRVVFSAFLLATSRFLAKVLQPAIAFVTFNSLALLCRITKSQKLQELYDDMKKKYDKGESYYE